MSIEGETKLEDLSDEIKKMKGFDKAWANYQKWLKKERNKK